MRACAGLYPGRSPHFQFLRWMLVCPGPGVLPPDSMGKPASAGGGPWAGSARFSPACWMGRWGAFTSAPFGGEGLLVFERLAQAVLQALNGVACVDGFPDVGGIGGERAGLVPAAFPLPAADRVPAIPFFPGFPGFLPGWFMCGALTGPPQRRPRLACALSSLRISASCLRRGPCNFAPGRGGRRR